MNHETPMSNFPDDEIDLRELIVTLLKGVKKPYGLCNSAQEIFTIIEERIDSITIQKSFFDIKYSL